MVQNSVSRQFTRRELLAAIAAMGAGAGCRHSRPSLPVSPPLAPAHPATVVLPAEVAAAPQLTDHPVRFTDITRQANIIWQYSNGATGRHLFVETTGGAVALFDYNNDGLLDILAVQSGPVPGAGPAERNFPSQHALYRNNGDGTFTDVTVGSGLERCKGYGQGVAIADYDNDGWADIYITAYGGSHLFKNNRDGTFTDVSQPAGLRDTAAELPWPLSAAWADYNNDGHLDLFVCHYARWSLKLNHDCMGSDGKLAYCRPQVYESGHNRLYRNNGNGTFTDVTQSSGIGTVAGKSMGAVWFDYDDDGWMDLFVTNDTMANFLFHNNRNGTFTETAVVAGCAVGPDGQPMSGMGIGVADYDNDGKEDLFVVNFSGEPKTVLHNMGHGLFENVSYPSNVGSTSLQYLGFGLDCLDYDLDGYKDFIVGNGHVLDRADARGNGSTYAQSQQLFRNQRNGTFALDLRSLGDLATPRVTRGLAVGDWDNDGDWDVAMVAQNGALQLYRNDGGNSNGFFTVRLEGVKSNRDAIGARVRVGWAHGTQTQWVRGGSSYISHSDRRVTFGLGDAVVVNWLEVRWPTGVVQRFGRLAGNRFYWLREGAHPMVDPRVRQRTERQ